MGRSCVPGTCLSVLLLLIATALPSGATFGQANSEVRALLVGVGEPSAEDGAWVSLSASRDLTRLARALRARGVQEQGLRVLEADEATAAGILQSIEQHLATAPPGSQVLLHFSGHAEQIADDGADEPDGLDEAWVPHGARTGDDDSLLRDDTIGAALDAVRLALGPQGSVVVTVDACHGAGTLRGMDAQPRAHAGVLESRDGPSLAPLVVLAATRSGSEAREVTDANGRLVGAFTAALADVLVARPSVRTWGAVFERVRARMRGVLPGVQPVLGGAGELSILGAEPRRSAWAVEVGDRLGDGRYVLEGGLLHGIAVGSRLELHRDDADAPSAATRVTVVTVETAGAASALARADDDQAEMSGRLRAFVTTPSAAGLSVSIEEGLADVGAIRTLAAEAGVDVTRDRGDLALQRVDRDVVLTHRVTNEVLLRSSGPDVDADAVGAVLRRLVAARRVLALALVDEELAVDARLQAASVGSCEEAGAYLEPADSPTVAVGQTIRLEVEHQGSLPAWITVVHVDEHGFGRQLAPLIDAPAEPLAPGVRWVAPTCWTVTPPVSPQRLRVLATRRPAELGALLAGETLRAVPPEGFAADIALQVRSEVTR